MPEIDISKARVFDKTVFSMLIPAVEKVLEEDAGRKAVVLFGIEVRSCTCLICGLLLFLLYLFYGTVGRHRSTQGRTRHTLPPPQIRPMVGPWKHYMK